MDSRSLPILSRASFGEGAEGEIEVRQLFEIDDFEPSDAVERLGQTEKTFAGKKGNYPTRSELSQEARGSRK